MRGERNRLDLGQLLHTTLGCRVDHLRIKRQVCVNRGHVDNDTSITLIDHLLCRLLSTKEHTLEIDIHNAGVLLRCDVEKMGLVDVIDTGVCNVDIQPAKTLHCLLDNPVQVIQPGYVTVDEHGFATGSFKLTDTGRPG